MISRVNKDIEIRCLFKDTIPVPSYLKYIDFIVKDKGQTIVIEFKNLSSHILPGAKIHLYPDQGSGYGFLIKMSGALRCPFRIGEAKASIPELKPSGKTHIEFNLDYLESGPAGVSFYILYADKRIINIFPGRDDVDKNFWFDSYSLLTESDFAERKSKKLAVRGLIASLIMTSLILINQLTDNGLPRFLRAVGSHFNYLLPR